MEVSYNRLISYWLRKWKEQIPISKWKGRLNIQSSLSLNTLY